MDGNVQSAAFFYQISCYLKQILIFSPFSITGISRFSRKNAHVFLKYSFIYIKSTQYG